MVLKAILLTFVALALLWAVSLGRAQRQEAKAETRFPSQGDIIRLGATDVHALVMGDGPALVLIHGAARVQR